MMLTDLQNKILDDFKKIHQNINIIFTQLESTIQPVATSGEQSFAGYLSKVSPNIVRSL